MPINVDISRIQLQPVTVTFLDMHEKKEIPAAIPGTHFQLLTRPIATGDYRRYYYGVGEKHFWLDRIVMPDQELYEKINAANVDIYLFLVNGEAAGFAEFIIDKRFVELLYFGLLPEFVGKGYGHYFLQWAIGKAWSYGPEWIQLNTCTLDHPNALPTYKKAGFRFIRTETHERKVIS